MVRREATMPRQVNDPQRVIDAPGDVVSVLYFEGCPCCENESYRFTFAEGLPCVVDCMDIDHEMPEELRAMVKGARDGR